MLRELGSRRYRVTQEVFFNFVNGDLNSNRCRVIEMTMYRFPSPFIGTIGAMAHGMRRNYQAQLSCYVHLPCFLFGTSPPYVLCISKVDLSGLVHQTPSSRDISFTVAKVRRHLRRKDSLELRELKNLKRPTRMNRQKVCMEDGWHSPIHRMIEHKLTRTFQTNPDARPWRMNESRPTHR